MKATLLYNATVVTAEKEAVGSVLVLDSTIEEVIFFDREDYGFRVDRIMKQHEGLEVINLEGKWLMAGGIDAHVHFREPDRKSVV